MKEESACSNASVPAKVASYVNHDLIREIWRVRKNKDWSVATRRYPGKRGEFT